MNPLKVKWKPLCLIPASRRMVQGTYIHTVCASRCAELPHLSSHATKINNLAPNCTGLLVCLWVEPPSVCSLLKPNTSILGMTYFSTTVCKKDQWNLLTCFKYLDISPIKAQKNSKQFCMMGWNNVAIRLFVILFICIVSWLKAPGCWPSLLFDKAHKQLIYKHLFLLNSLPYL